MGVKVGTQVDQIVTTLVATQTNLVEILFED